MKVLKVLFSVTLVLLVCYLLYASTSSNAPIPISYFWLGLLCFTLLMFIFWKAGLLNLWKQYRVIMIVFFIILSSALFVSYLFIARNELCASISLKECDESLFCTVEESWVPYGSTGGSAVTMAFESSMVCVPKLFNSKFMGDKPY